MCIGGLCLWIATCGAFADEPRQARDVLTGAVDPPEIGMERRRFLVAAGVDAELDESEFQLDKAHGDGFVRAFEKWEQVELFDRDKNGRIDWFEAEAYRLRLRGRVLARHDTDKDAHLTGDERLGAIESVASISVAPEESPALATTSSGKSPRPAFAGPDVLVDKSGRRFEVAKPPEYGGPVDDIWGLDARDMDDWKRQSLVLFDANRDGKIDDDESKKMGEHMKARLLEVIDFNGNGEIDPQENEKFRGFMLEREEHRTMRSLRKRFDSDGDGVLTPSEERAVLVAREELRREQEAMQRAFIRRNDADGDGKLTPEEMRNEGRYRRDRDKRQLREFDTDGDGRIEGEEKTRMAQAMRDRWAEARKQFDTNGDGELDREERLRYLESGWEPY